MLNQRHCPDFLITIIVPCFNEELTIERFYQELIVVIKRYNYKIIFIDDGSHDLTLIKIKEIIAQNSLVSYISFSRNFGHQLALKAGYDHALSADCVVTIDADLQQSPLVIVNMIEKWQQGYHVVNAVRKKNERVNLFKRFTALAFYKIINSFSTRKIIQNGPDFRLLDKKVVGIIHALKEHNIFLREIISWIGFNHTTVDFDVEERIGGKTKYSLKKMISLSLNAFFAYGINPLRIAIFTGIFLSLSSFLYGFYAIYNYLYTSKNIPGWTSLMASFLFVAGFQFILIGVIGEYLGRTFIATRGRPSYLIKEMSVI
jgi:glycosyltransferase involved in cell wall biosynthesis